MVLGGRLEVAMRDTPNSKIPSEKFLGLHNQLNLNQKITLQDNHMCIQLPSLQIALASLLYQPSSL